MDRSRAVRQLLPLVPALVFLAVFFLYPLGRMMTLSFDAPEGPLAYYTSIAFLAEVVGGSQHPADGEMSELRYFTASQCEALNLSPASRIIAEQAFGASRAYFRPASWLPPA